MRDIKLGPISEEHTNTDGRAVSACIYMICLSGCALVLVCLAGTADDARGAELCVIVASKSVDTCKASTPISDVMIPRCCHYNSIDDEVVSGAVPDSWGRGFCSAARPKGGVGGESA